MAQTLWSGKITPPRNSSSRLRVNPNFDPPSRGGWESSCDSMRMERAQSLSSSLIDVFARVRASTRLTITAQESNGLSGPPGSDPGTTTE